METRVPERMLQRQHGIVTRAQLVQCGMTDAQIQWRVRSGRWHRLTVGIFATFTGELTEQHRLVLAGLHVGPVGQITGTAALRWHGFRYVPVGRTVSVLAPPSCGRRSIAGCVRVITTRRLDRRVYQQGPLVLVSPARAVADEARQTRSLRQVRAMVAEGVQRGFATVPVLAAELDEGRRNGSALLRQAVEEVRAGTRSAPEAELREIVGRSRILPLILWNPRLRLPDGAVLAPDGWIAESAIALEVDSREYHLNPEDWERTMRRHNALASLGVVVLHVSPGRMRSDARGVSELVERAHLARCGRGLTAPITVIT